MTHPKTTKAKKPAKPKHPKKTAKAKRTTHPKTPKAHP